MTADKPKGQPNPRETAQRDKATTTQNPQWANGLRQLYDSVVDEPLPDMFKDLLSKLDAKD